MERHLIEQFAAGGPQLRAAVAGLEERELSRPTAPGTWSIRQLVIHLADSDAIAIDRMKRILTEDNPTLLNSDETAYVDRLHLEAQSVTDALDLFEIGRRQFARVLRQLSDASFSRTGTHNQRGTVTLGQLVGDYVGHLTHHLTYVHAKRERLGRPAE